MRTLVLLLLLLLLLLAAGCSDSKPDPAPAPAAPSPGSAPAIPSIASASDRETLFLGVPTSKAVGETIRKLSSVPHVAGTQANANVARELMATLGRMKIRVGVAEYHVYLPYPKTLSIKVRGDAPLELATVERATGPTAPELRGWNAYSANGKVAAPVVYGGFGRDEELAALRRAGVDPKGKVVLLRYGPLYRGAQVASAERHGAAAVIFYVDPKDEPERSRDSIQRGTVVYYWQYTGDPVTPGVAASKAAKRVAIAKSEVLPKIPVLTITATEAAKLIARIGGPAAPAELAGALPGAYRLGPGPVVEVHVELDGETRVIRDLIAMIPGSDTEPPAAPGHPKPSEQAVLLGTHYDTWGSGAIGPHSGTAALVEIARGFTALSRAGWKPRRTIIVAFWDAEELGAVGSTEWVEEQLAQLRRTAVAYFNIDTIEAGPLVVQGTPALRELVRGCAGDVVDPATGKPVIADLEDLGIGSDSTAFLHHAGVPSLQWQSGAGKGGDPDVAAIASFAKVMGLCALRLADAEALPLRYSETAAWLTAALGTLAATTTATKLRLDRTRLDAALEKLRAAATRAESAPVRAGGTPTACNQGLIAAERGFLADDGLVDRPWYRHLATGPDPANGYGALLLPELAAAADQRALDRATTRLAAAIERVATALAPCP